MTYYICSAGIIGEYCTKMFAEQNPPYIRVVKLASISELVTEQKQLPVNWLT